MMSALEWRILRLETQLILLQQQIASLQASTGLLQQQQWTPSGGGGGGGSTSGFYVCMGPASGSIVGTWSGSAPTGAGSFSATVYQVGGTGTIVNLGTATVTNWMPATLANSKACILIPDGTGAYGVVSQSCT